MTLPSHVVEDKIVLGRHQEHDERSKLYPAQVSSIIPDVPVYHKRVGGVFNQKKLGSCTGNAAAGLCMTQPLHRTGRHLHESDAVKIYELATTLDNVSGSYPPDDTGSSGIAAAKAAVQMGLAKSYTHAFGIDHARGVIALSPFMQGTIWTQSMFQPNEDGVLELSGQPIGGHEYECVAHDPRGMNDKYPEPLWGYANSWGTAWGVAIPEAGLVHGGGFWIRESDLNFLLNQGGDITVLVS